MDFSKFTIEEKNSLCEYWYGLNLFNGDVRFVPCSVYIENFDKNFNDYEEWGKNSTTGNYMYSNIYEAYVGTEFWDNMYEYINSNFVGEEDRNRSLNAPVLKQKIIKLQEQEQINTLFNNTSAQLQTTPATLMSAIGLTMVVVISFIAIKKGLKYFISMIKNGDSDIL